MKREKRKRNNLFLSFMMLFAMFSFIISPFSVYALDVEPDTVCKSGTEYTIYYLFLDAEGEQPNTGTQPLNAYSTEKNFKGAKKNASDKITATGIIDVVNGGSNSATNLSSWSLNTFYTVFNRAVQDSTNYLYKPDNNNIYSMSVKWFDGNGNQHQSNAAANLEVSQLVGASAQSTDLPSVKIPTFTVDSQSATANIVRDLSTWTNSVWSDSKAIHVTLSDGGDFTCMFHPYVKYVKVCEPDTNQSGSNPSDPGDSSKVTLSYIANAGNDTVTNLPNSKTDDKGKDFTVDDNIPKRTGYAFQGWAESASGNVKYKANDVIKNLNTDKKLYAIWEKVPEGGYKVEYDPNGGVGAPGSETAGPNECVTISSTKPTMSGAKFLGWSTNKGATSADSNYNPGKEYCGKNGDLKLFAVWSGGSATSNPKTGVADYAIAFGLLGAAAGAGLFISKRKNLFKQI